MSQRSVLVTGASGQVGHAVVELLLERAHGSIIATTRTPEKHADLAAKGVDVRFADFDQPESVAKAFAGARRILLVSTNTLDGTGRRVLQHRNAINAACQVGAEHVVYTSFLKATDSPLGLMAADHAATEGMIVESGLGYTSLRNAFYTEMVLVTLAGAAARGYLLSAAGDGRIAYVTREDCARAAAAALAGDFKGQRILDITGPSAITSAELAALATRVLGTSIVSVSVTTEELERRMVSSGMPEPLARVLAGIDRGVSQGAMDVRSDGLQQLTGRQPMSVATFISAHRGALAGPQPPPHQP